MGAAKPHYAKASTKVSTPMLALDCTGSAKKTCGKYKVTGYPTIKYYADDDFEDYSGGRQEKDFVKFLSKVTEDAEVVDDADDDDAAGSAGAGAKAAADAGADAGAKADAGAGDSAKADASADAGAGADAGAKADAGAGDSAGADADAGA